MFDVKQSFTWFCDTDKTHQNRVKWIFYVKCLDVVFIKEKIVFEVAADTSPRFYVTRDAPWPDGSHFW